MCCNSDLHNEFINMNEGICPFCNQLLIEGNKDDESCCSGPNLCNKNGLNICVNCGIVHSCVYASEFINFYENMYKIRRKSIYQRKYHIENVMNDICFENSIDLTHDQRERIFKVFAEISDIIPTVNGRRNRLISTKYILRQLFKLLDLPFECIKITKSRKTLEFYNRYWAKILELKNTEILRVIK